MTAPQPEIAVTYADPYNGYPTEVYDDYGSVDFGSTMVDAPLQRTFTIHNSGAGTLALVWAGKGGQEKGGRKRGDRKRGQD